MEPYFFRHTVPWSIVYRQMRQVLTAALGTIPAGVDWGVVEGHCWVKCPARHLHWVLAALEAAFNQPPGEEAGQ